MGSAGASALRQWPSVSLLTAALRSVRTGCTLPRTDSSRRLVLLAGLDPIFRIGIARAIEESGADVLDGPAWPDDLVRSASDAAPDAIVLGDGSRETSVITKRLRDAAPAATVVLWHMGAQMVVVLAPGKKTPPRVVPAPAPAELSKELFGYSSEGETCPRT